MKKERCWNTAPNNRIAIRLAPFIVRIRKSYSTAILVQPLTEFNHENVTKYLLIVCINMLYISPISAQIAMKDTLLTNERVNIAYNETDDTYVEKSPDIGSYEEVRADWINRSYYKFDISEISSYSNVTIDSVEVIYQTGDVIGLTVEGNYTFSLTGADIGSLSNPDETDIWNEIADSDTLETDVSYSESQQILRSDSIKAYLSNHLSDNYLYIGALSMDEDVTGSAANLFMKLIVTYERDSTELILTARNDFHGEDGGNIGVGINATPSSYSSPKSFTGYEDQTLKLAAYDGFTGYGSDWVFNDSEAPNRKSEWEWRKTNEPTGTFGENDQTPTYGQLDTDDNGAIFAAIQRAKYPITRNDYSPEMGSNINTTNVTVIEGNTITAPATQTDNGIDYTFYEWSDGETDNPRIIDSPTSSLTAHYKVFNATSSINVMGIDQRRKIVEDVQHDKVYRVYESDGQLWYQWRDRNTNAWSYEKRIQTPADGYFDVQNPSIAISDGRLWVVYEYYDGSVTWLAVTKIINPSASTPVMKDQNIEFFMGQNSIEEVSTSGIQYTSQPYESYSRGAIFVAAYSDLGILVPIVYAFSETSTGGINVSYASNLHFLSNGRQPVDVSGGISTAANYNSIGFTWSDGSEVYSNHGYFDTNTRTIKANLIATEVVSDYNPQFSGSTNPTISQDGGAFSVAFPTLWNSTAVGPINIIAETEVTSQATDLTIYMATDGYSGLQFSNPLLGKDTSPATATDGYLVAKQNGSIKLFEKTSGNWIKFKQFGNIDRTVSEYITEDGMIGSYSSPISGTSLSELKEFEAYDGSALKINRASVSSMISAYWESQAKDSVFHEFWLGELAVEDEVLPIEISSSNRYEITLTKPFVLDSRNIKISYNHAITDAEVPLNLAAFDTLGNRIQTWEPAWHSSSAYSNVMAKYTEAISGFNTEMLTLDNKTTRIPVVLKLVSKNSTKIHWAQIGVKGFEGKKKQYDREDETKRIQEIPDDFNLHANYPNPFNPTTNITYDLPQDAEVTLIVYDITGREVALYNEGRKRAGSHSITFNAGNLSSGIYMYKLQAGEFSSTRKMLLIK